MMCSPSVLVQSLTLRLKEVLLWVVTCTLRIGLTLLGSLLCNTKHLSEGGRQHCVWLYSQLFNVLVILGFCPTRSSVCLRYVCWTISSHDHFFSRDVFFSMGMKMFLKIGKRDLLQFEVLYVIIFVYNPIYTHIKPHNDKCTLFEHKYDAKRKIIEIQYVLVQVRSASRYR